MSGESPKGLRFLYLLEVVGKVVDIFCVVTQGDDLVLDQGLDEVGDDPGHLSTFLVVLRDALRLLQVLEGEGLDELGRYL